MGISSFQKKKLIPWELFSFFQFPLKFMIVDMLTFKNKWFNYLRLKLKSWRCLKSPYSVLSYQILGCSPDRRNIEQNTFKWSELTLKILLKKKLFIFHALKILFYKTVLYFETRLLPTTLVITEWAAIL